jgi:negative regulator of sigma E activity
VTDERHDDIAARLRDEAGARAPERLRADVMMRVRAEPRPRRIRPKRQLWRPLGSLAAAACVLAALVFGLSRLQVSGNGSESAGATSAAAAGAGGGVAALAPNAGHGSTEKRAGAAPQRLPAPSAVHTTPGTDQALRLQATLVPRPLRWAIFGRLALPPPLPLALGTLDLHRGHGSH